MMGNLFGFRALRALHANRPFSIDRAKAVTPVIVMQDPYTPLP